MRHDLHVETRVPLDTSLVVVQWLQSVMIVFTLQSRVSVLMVGAFKEKQLKKRSNSLRQVLLALTTPSHLAGAPGS